MPVSEVASRQQLRSAFRHQLLLIPLYRRRTFGRRAFAVAGPTFWNNVSLWCSYILLCLLCVVGATAFARGRRSRENAIIVLAFARCRRARCTLIHLCQFIILAGSQDYKKSIWDCNAYQHRYHCYWNIASNNQYQQHLNSNCQTLMYTVLHTLYKTCYYCTQLSVVTY